MFLRLLSLVLVSAPVIMMTLWFSGNPGQVVLEWLGWHIETNVPIFLLALLVVFVVLFVLEQGLSSLTSLPGRLRKSRQAKGLERGLNALVEALDAAAAGDMDNGRRLGAEAVRHLHRPDLAERLDRLMPRPAVPAVAAAAGGKSKTAQKKLGWWTRLTMRKPRLPPRPSVPSMVSAPVPAPPLPPIVMPESPPERVPAPVFDLDALTAAIQAADWAGARQLAESAPPQWINVVQLGQALAVAETDPLQARDLAAHVLAVEPAHWAAVQLALRLDVAAGRRAEAQAVVQNLWRVQPSFRAITLAAPLWADADAATRAAWIDGLVKLNPDHAESHLALGAQAVADGKWGAARLHLVAAIKAKPLVDAFQLMIQVEQQDGGDSAAIEMWHRRAADAAPAATWRCASCGGVAVDWSASCPHCAAVGSMA